MAKHSAASDSLATRVRSFTNSLTCRLLAPIDPASLAVFRICFGLVIVWGVVRSFWDAGGINKIQYQYVNPAWHFHYPGFAWVEALPEPWMSGLFVVMAIAGLCLALGIGYRLAATGVFLTYTYTFLIDQARYNNHYYLICLVAFLLIWMPADRKFSLGTWLRRRRQTDDHNDRVISPASTIPFWPVFLIRAQLFVMYFYGGLAKINADWLTGEPLLAPGLVVHRFFSETLWLPEAVSVQHVCLVLAWGGLFYDLGIGFLLVFRRTRLLALALTFAFHLHNQFVFPIGVFPVLAFTSTLIFFSPDWPIRCWNALKHFARRLAPRQMARPCAASIDNESQSTNLLLPVRRWLRDEWVLALIVAWLVIQAVVPLRHHVLPGDANWTEQGQRFSWRMMLRAKAASNITFHVHDPSLQRKDSRGGVRIDWEKWPAEQPRAIYVPVDSPRFVWSDHPGLTLTHEPLLGERILFNSTAADEAGRERECTKVRRRWQALFGRTPTLTRTLSMAELLERMEVKIRERRTDLNVSAKRIDLVLSDLRTAREHSQHSQRLGPSAVEQYRRELVDMLTSVLRVPPLAELVRGDLARLQPFALQGSQTAELHHIYLVTDAALPADQRGDAMLRLSNGKEYLVWVDLSRLRYDDMQRLPLWFITFERRELWATWNHFRELNIAQIERFSVRPQMIHQYANHIADVWHKQQGQVPAVHVNSFVTLNYRRPQPLIDPAVDLVTAPMQHFGTNDWILPLEQDTSTVARRLTPVVR